MTDLDTAMLRQVFDLEGQWANGSDIEFYFKLALDEIDRLRAKIKDADEEVWRLVRDEYLWVCDTRNLRRILSD